MLARSGGDPARARGQRRPPGGVTRGYDVAAGQTYTVAATTRVSAVTIESGGVLAAPAGHSLTMTVNGVETGQRLVATGAADTAFVPGSWRGDIVLTVTTADDVPWQQHTYPFRQALYVAAAVVPAYSVLAAAVGGQALQPRRPQACGSPRPASASTASSSTARTYRLDHARDHPRRQRPL